MDAMAHGYMQDAKAADAAKAGEGKCGEGKCAAGMQDAAKQDLTPAQQKYWQPVETALREVTLQIEDYQKRLKRRDDSFDTNSDAIQRLKTATRALYAQLTGTQKNDLTLLVRMTGLGPAFAELTGTKAAKNASEDSR